MRDTTATKVSVPDLHYFTATAKGVAAVIMCQSNTHMYLYMFTNGDIVFVFYIHCIIFNLYHSLSHLCMGQNAFEDRLPRRSYSSLMSVSVSLTSVNNKSLGDFIQIHHL